MSERITRQDLEVQLLMVVRHVQPDAYVMKLSGRHAAFIKGDADNITQEIPGDEVPTGAPMYYLEKHPYGYVVELAPAARNTEGGTPFPGGISHPFGQSLRTAKEMHAALYVAWQSHAFKADLAGGWWARANR